MSFFGSGFGSTLTSAFGVGLMAVGGLANESASMFVAAKALFNVEKLFIKFEPWATA
jgi:hypothetical protein